LRTSDSGVRNPALAGTTPQIKARIAANTRAKTLAWKLPKNCLKKPVQKRAPRGSLYSAAYLS